MCNLYNSTNLCDLRQTNKTIPKNTMSIIIEKPTRQIFYMIFKTTFLAKPFATILAYLAFGSQHEVLDTPCPLPPVMHHLHLSERS